MSGRDPKTEATWRGRIARFGETNLTLTEFCRREGVSRGTFGRWRRRFESQRQGKSGTEQPTQGSGTLAAPATGLFVPVNAPSVAVAEIEFPNGVRIRVPATNAEALRVALTTGNDLFREVR